MTSTLEDFASRKVTPMCSFAYSRPVSTPVFSDLCVACTNYNLRLTADGSGTLI